MHDVHEAQPLWISHVRNKYKTIRIYTLHVTHFTRTDHRYVYDLYFEKRIHFNRYTYKIDLTPSFIREPACGRLYQFVDACARTMVVCVNAGRAHTHASENTYTYIVRLRADPQPLVVSDLTRPAPSRRHMCYNLDIPYIHVQDMPPILNIPSCNS